MIFRDVIQVAGIRDADEAGVLVECGVDWFGFPLRLHHHREDLSVRDAAEIIAGLPAQHRAVLITYLNRAPEVVALCREIGVTTVQLHGDITTRALDAIRDLEPCMTIVKSLVVGLDDRQGVEPWMARYLPHVDAFITDSFDSSTGARGATGLSHDWNISRRVVELSPKPVILAGGLTPVNVERAIVHVRPAGVDVHTGVEDAAGRKDPESVRAFVAAARKSFNTPRP